MYEHGTLEYVSGLKFAVYRFNDLEHVTSFVLDGHTAVGFPGQPYLLVY